MYETRYGSRLPATCPFQISSLQLPGKVQPILGNEGHDDFLPHSHFSFPPSSRELHSLIECPCVVIQSLARLSSSTVISASSHKSHLVSSGMTLARSYHLAYVFRLSERLINFSPHLYASPSEIEIGEEKRGRESEREMRCALSPSPLPLCFSESIVIYDSIFARRRSSQLR